MNGYNDEPKQITFSGLIFWAVVITGWFGLIAYVILEGGK
jgi:hypothetical protein